MDQIMNRMKEVLRGAQASMEQQKQESDVIFVCGLDQLHGIFSDGILDREVYPISNCMTNS